MIKKKQKGFVNFKQLFLFAKQNYFVTVIALCVLFVGVVSVYKLFIAKPTYVYVKVKVGQGLWWANTAKPSMWFIQAIQSAKEEKDLTGSVIAKIINVTYYPWWGVGQFDTYVTARLKVSKIGKDAKYNFKRSTIGIGAPIDFEFNSVQFSGTVIELYEKPPTEKKIEKIVTLVKQGGYNKDSPYFYENIKTGDKYFNGEEVVFEVLDKRLDKQLWIITNNLTAETFEREIDTNKNIIVKAKVKCVLKNGQCFFAEEQILIPGRDLSAATPNFFLNSFTVVKVE